ncbi:MAG: hypothetical protein R3D43_14130 [Tepidamorphaceae bacterium]
MWERLLNALRARPTPQGTFYETRDALNIDAALEGVRLEMGRLKQLRVHAPSCLGASTCMESVAFQRRFPGAMVDLVLENRDVDLVYET